MNFTSVTFFPSSPYNSATPTHCYGNVNLQPNKPIHANEQEACENHSLRHTGQCPQPAVKEGANPGPCYNNQQQIISTRTCARPFRFAGIDPLAEQGPNSPLLYLCTSARRQLKTQSANTATISATASSRPCMGTNAVIVISACGHEKTFTCTCKLSLKRFLFLPPSCSQRFVKERRVSHFDFSRSESADRLQGQTKLCSCARRSSMHVTFHDARGYSFPAFFYPAGIAQVCTQKIQIESFSCPPSVCTFGPRHSKIQNAIDIYITSLYTTVRRPATPTNDLLKKHKVRNSSHRQHIMHFNILQRKTTRTPKRPRLRWRFTMGSTSSKTRYL